jgi:class 3 adenylate cyclase
MDAAALEALGLYDPNDTHAELHLQLLTYLIELGATKEDLLAYRDMLPGLAGVLMIRGGPALSMAEVAERSGSSMEQIRQLVRTTGFPDPGPDARVFIEGFVTLASGARDAAVGVLGEDVLYQLLRVMGSAMARVADAAVSAFLVNVEPPARREDPVGLAVARANVEATSLLPLIPPALDVLFRQHVLAVQRTVLPDADLVGYETQHLAVSFVDLVGSTELAEHLALPELGTALSSFEEMAMDTVVAEGGRVVKLIGDEVLYIALDAGSACHIALNLVAACKNHPVLPEVRAGLARGKVMLRDGDVFGPVVNLAARVVKVAEPGEVLATVDVASAAGIPHVSRGTHYLKGITGPTELVALISDGSF